MACWLPRLHGGMRIAAAVAAGLFVVAIGLVALRKPVLEELAELYFARYGTNAHVHIEQWDGSRLTAQIDLGVRPDFSARKIEIEFNPDYWLPHIERVSVVESRLHIFFDGHSVSFGSLQPLVDALKRPKPKSWTDRFFRQPLALSIEKGRASIETPAGPLEIVGPGELAGSRVCRV